jgi:long-chain acyl-CoA synthetase
MAKKFEPHMSDSPPFTIEIEDGRSSSSSQKPNETLPRRNIKYKDHLLSRPADDSSINTVFDIVKRAATKFGDQPCMGWRDLIKIHTEITYTKKVVDGEQQQIPKEWTYYELTGYKYITYQEYEQLVLQVGSGLRKLGLSREDRVHVYAATR